VTWIDKLWLGAQVKWAFIKARGITAPAAAAYVILWVAVTLASRFSVSALGLQFVPVGRAGLDTVSVLLMLLPAVIVSRCLWSRCPTVEATRSRPSQPSELLWSAVLGLGATASPLPAVPLLHDSIDPLAFVADWWLLLGVLLVLSGLTAVPIGVAASFAVIATFSTPNVVPWEANLLYNVDLAAQSAMVGAVLLTAGLLLVALRRRAA